MMKRLPSYASIIAALAVIIFGFIYNKTPYEIAIRVVIAIVVVYICSLIVRTYLVKRVLVRPNETVEPDGDNDQSEAMESQEDLETEPADSFEAYEEDVKLQ